MRFRWIAPAGAALMLAGCGAQVLHVESDTAWTGTIASIGPVEGRGSRDFELSGSPDRGQVCWSIQKASDAGTLRVWVEQSTWFGLGNDIDADNTTTDPLGVVNGCAR